MKLRRLLEEDFELLGAVLINIAWAVGGVALIYFLRWLGLF